MSRTCSARGRLRRAGGAFGAMGSFFTSHVVSRKIVAMRLRFALVTLMAACGNDGSMLPVGGGGNDGGFGFPDGGGGTTDGRAIDAPSGTPTPIDAGIFTGRVCLTSDARNLDACATTGADGFTVRLGTQTAVTAADGTFMIKADAAPFYIVTGSTIVTSVKRVGDYEIPALTRTLFSSMVSANLVGYPPNPGEGHLMAQLIHNGMPVAGASAEALPTATWNPFYNGTSATAWTQSASGTNSTAWIPSIDVGAVDVTFHGAGDEVKQTGLSIQDGAITFTTVIFP